MGRAGPIKQVLKCQIFNSGKGPEYKKFTSWIENRNKPITEFGSESSDLLKILALSVIFEEKLT